MSGSGRRQHYHSGSHASASRQAAPQREVQQAQLQAYFQQFGEITDCYVSAAGGRTDCYVAPRGMRPGQSGAEDGPTRPTAPALNVTNAVPLFMPVMRSFGRKTSVT